VPLWARLVLHVWAFAICASVLTTWQHHFIDIPTGALLGMVCVWLWPLERVVSMRRAWQTHARPQRWKLAGFYAVGAVLFLASRAVRRRHRLWLAGPPHRSPGGAQLRGFGARGFQMDGRGRMGWAARWLFAPYRLGAAVNAWLWTRKLPASVEVVPGLRLGRRPTHAEWLAAGQPRLVSLCAELQLPRVPHARCVPLLDLTVPPTVRLQRAAAVIEGQRRNAEAPTCGSAARSASRAARRRPSPGWAATARPAAWRRPKTRCAAHGRRSCCAAPGAHRWNRWSRFRICRRHRTHD
jgi:hypothetical protein